MKLKVKRLVTALVVVLVLGATGWGIHVLAQGDAMSQQMEMMKQKMMNRPDAMKEADQAVQEQKKKAMTEGKYMCCLKSSCDFCALKMGECPCGMNAASDKPCRSPKFHPLEID